MSWLELRVGCSQRVCICGVYICMLLRPLHEGVRSAGCFVACAVVQCAITRASHAAVCADERNQFELRSRPANILVA